MGLDQNQSLNVGFNKANFKKNINLVDSVTEENAPIISREAIYVAGLLETYFRANKEKYPPFHKIVHTGVFRTVVIYINKNYK